MSKEIFRVDHVLAGKIPLQDDQCRFDFNIFEAKVKELVRERLGDENHVISMTSESRKVSRKCNTFVVAKLAMHSDAELYSPMAVLKGKEAIVKATSNFMNSFESLTIRSQFGSSDQAMIVYDVDIPGISKDFPGASLMSFRDGLIVKIQLFYDSSRIVEKKEEIFS